MATLVFSALGTLVGGPVGGAIGALLGREADRAIVGAPTREGPRLTELAVSTSSYGQPIARLFGATRAAGTIIWATDLKESSETGGGGKGRPRTRQYAYSISLAVALSSRPIEGVGRIWADGNLLRGEAGDLKTGGALRVHLGHADQAPDPLLAAALGARCPAHRGLAYAVFEDLQLADFGNRIPALSFEVFADGAGESLVRALAKASGAPVTGRPVPQAGVIEGFAHEGGQVAQVLDLLGEVLALAAASEGAGLALGPEDPGAAPAVLPEPVAWPDGDFGTRTGARRARTDVQGPSALRYYDSGRDYQPGLQRAAGRARLAGERALELPATLSADGARALIAARRRRDGAASERMRIRVAALDPAIAPGAVVAVPGEGVWRVAAWEWRSGGVELDLRRFEGAAAAAPRGDSGNPWRPVDRLPAATLMEAFELPWDGAGAPDVERVHAALGAGPGRWSGAALYVERAGALLPAGTAAPVRAAMGRLERPLAASPAIVFEPEASLEVLCDDPAAEFASADGAALAAGANRLLVGDEIVQFMQAMPLGAGRWRLAGLLRGRGGTEAEAGEGHTVGTRVCLLDDRLHLLDGAAFDPATERLAAIGVADPEPVYAAVRAPGRSRRPLAPVHPVASPAPDGGLLLEWTRRARGSWVWRDGVDVPLVEESERYEVGAGPADAPLAVWSAAAPALALAAGDLAPLPPGTLLWVRQIGSHARSRVLALHLLP
jgi:hypothetical protein